MNLVNQLTVLLHQPIHPTKEQQQLHCPFHDDRVKSFSLNIRKGVWYCFGCGVGGGLQALAELLDGEIDDAEIIMRTTNQEPEKEPVDFTDFLKHKTTLDRKVIYNYLEERNIGWPVAYHFKFRTVGDTLVMPYYDGDRIVALRYRSHKGDKWYEPGSERTIYNVNEVRGAKSVILCEGESDTHAVWDYFDMLNEDVTPKMYAVGGVPGANSSRATWELWALDFMWAEKIWIAFDNDEAGDKGAEKAIEILPQKAVRLSPYPHNDWSIALKEGTHIELV